MTTPEEIYSNLFHVPENQEAAAWHFRRTSQSIDRNRVSVAQK